MLLSSCPLLGAYLSNCCQDIYPARIALDCGHARRPLGPRGQALRHPALLGAVADLVTAVLGYVRSRDALEEAIYNQLTGARRAKARQVETVFPLDARRADAAGQLQDGRRGPRGMRDAVDELDKTRPPEEMRTRLEAWYTEHRAARPAPHAGKDASIDDYLPGRAAATYLQYQYIAQQSRIPPTAAPCSTMPATAAVQRASRALPSPAARGGAHGRASGT
jgi:hypothetical protein